MLIWARANPLWSRTLLRLIATAALAIVGILILRPLGMQFGWPQDAAPIGGVVVALLGGRRIADLVATRLGIPPAIV